MNIKIIKIFFITLIVFGLGACTNNYQYTSRGTLEYASENGTTIKKPSVIYWRMDKGRLYYGSKYNASDSGISLRICERGTKSLEPDERNMTKDLVLLGKSGDIKIAEVDSMGKISMLDTAVPINQQKLDICGIFIIMTGDGTSLIKEGAHPEFVFMCENLIKVNRYPKVKKYTFNAVEKTEYIDENSAPNACVKL